MGLFDFFKKKDENKKDSPSKNENGNKSNPSSVNNDVERFEAEFLETIPRYVSVPTAQITLSAKHPVTQEKIPYAEIFPEQFNTWKTVRTLADRRGIIYSILDQHIGNDLGIWQVIERYNVDRYPEKALEIGKQATEEEKHGPNYWNALAKTYFILTRYAEAEDCCKKANEIEPENIRTQRIMADIYHYTNKEKEAHEIYIKILESKLPKDKQMNLDLTALLGFEGDLVNSPIYAAAWLKGDEKIEEDMWNWASDEFYYSPHFRAQHAYHLIKKGEHLKALVKLMTLSDEMPWYKEAAMNAYALIEQMNLSEPMMKEKAKLKALIDKNNWTADGMFNYTL